MIKRVLAAGSATVAAATLTCGLASPLAAAGTATVAPRFTAGQTYRVYQRINGDDVCLDASFEFSVCQKSADPDDPPAVQKWVVESGPGRTGAFWNQLGTGWCLDSKVFDGPCTSHGGSQKWKTVSAGNGTWYIEQSTRSSSICLDGQWTFKTCVRGDKNQIWTIGRLPS